MRAEWQDGREKLYVLQRLLALRRDDPELFAFGDYQPLAVSDGNNADRLCTFARRHGEAAIVVAVPRLTWGLFKHGGRADFGTSEIALPSGGKWREVFSGRSVEGERVQAGDLFADFPVAVLLAAAA